MFYIASWFRATTHRSAAMPPRRRSGPVTVQVRDIFPPRVSTGLAAVGTPAGDAGPVALDLSWSPNTESDLAGYFVYRRDVTASQTNATRLNANPAPAPSFHDA